MQGNKSTAYAHTFYLIKTEQGWTYFDNNFGAREIKGTKGKVEVLDTVAKDLNMDWNFSFEIKLDKDGNFIGTGGYIKPSFFWLIPYGKITGPKEFNTQIKEKSLEKVKDKLFLEIFHREDPLNKFLLLKMRGKDKEK